MKASDRRLQGNYIEGHFVEVTDPNGELLNRDPGDLEVPAIAVPYSYEHVHDAVEGARRGFAGWKRLSPPDRFAAIGRYRDLLEVRGKDLAVTISQETGKPLWEAKDEVAACLDLVDYFIELAKKTAATEKVQNVADEADGTIRHLPHGVMAVISPAHQPAFIPHTHFLPSLVFGNSVVLKSSQYAPRTGQCLAEMFHDAALPAGVVNVVHGSTEVARRLVAHSDVDGILFTGSFEAGAKIQKQILSDYWKIVVLDMGGKNALVVWDDCHYAKALHESLFSAFVTAGQRCTSAERIFVHEKLFDRFLQDFHKLAKKCKVGYGIDESADAPFMGPLISEASLENYLRYQGMAVREGCEEVMRGKSLERNKRGYYVSPSIHMVPSFDPKSLYQKSEVFGPNVAIYKVSDLDEVAEMINHTQHGLVASIYTSARENYQRFAEEARVSSIHWNRPTVDVSYRLPYGGIQRSGNARPMGSLAASVCTYPVSSLENTGESRALRVPEALPKLEVG